MGATIWTEEKIAPGTIEWEFGTAYEMFISLHVFHEPDYYGIRASWAAGVRSRIPPAERKLLEEVYPLMNAPLGWIHSLPAPRDAISALWALKQIPPAERMIKILGLDKPHSIQGTSEDANKYNQLRSTLLRIAETRSWKPEDVEFFVKLWGKKHSLKREKLERALDWWSRPEELGEGFLSGLQSYYQAFFEEEEKRIEPILRAGLERAQELATKLTMEELFVELSQGVQLGDEFRASKFILHDALPI